jgi:hypothetical protein
VGVLARPSILLLFFSSFFFFFFSPCLSSSLAETQRDRESEIRDERERLVEGEMQTRGREPERGTEREREKKQGGRAGEAGEDPMNPVTVDAVETRTRSSGGSTPAQQKVISGEWAENHPFDDFRWASHKLLRVISCN